MDNVWFRQQARIGLENFYGERESEFVDELSAGPHPHYRWIAWHFMAQRHVETPLFYQHFLDMVGDET